MERYELIVVGAGPAGLSAAIEAAEKGLKVVVFDENSRPGGQLFKQIHKFFGSKEHKAKIRGYKIGQELLARARALDVRVELNATVTGIFKEKEVCVMQNGAFHHYRGDSIIIATGAAENMLTFEGWTLPGVIGAGAAQTMMNLHGVLPGQKVLMVGSGNVGLVVSFQLMQAGCQVVAVIDGAPRVGGYGVHASKVARAGVPFYLSHTMVRAEGTDHVTGAVITQVDSKWQPVPGTEKHLDVDTICIAVGLSPMAQLARLAGCETVDDRKKGGLVPTVDKYGATSVPGVYCAGDVSGIEEASSAMIEGRIAGLAAAAAAGYMTEKELETAYDAQMASLNQLRQGMFAPKNKGRTDLTETEEGYALSKNLLAKGYVAEAEIAAFPSASYKAVGVHPVIECTQNIPCNPCQDSCPAGCIKIGENITSLPVLDQSDVCLGCGMCVASCPGQAIFLMDETSDKAGVLITVPYEFLPLPEKGAVGTALDRSGSPVCPAQVMSLRKAPAMDNTCLLTMRVPAEYAQKARFIRF